MGVMSFSEALSVFGLSSVYTESELKKKYRELIKQNHPDKHLQADPNEYDEYTRKVQKINDAYEILKRNINKGTNTSRTYQNSNLVFEREKCLEKLTSYLKTCDAQKLMQQISCLILEYIVKINSSNNPKITLLAFTQELEKIYKKYIDIYSKKHNIPAFIIKNYGFNYNCDCQKLYFQLKYCETKIENDISKIIRIFAKHKHYQILQKQIDLLIDELRLKLHNYDITKENYNDLLEEYINKIDALIIKYSQKYELFITALSTKYDGLDYRVKKYINDHIAEIVLKLSDKDIYGSLNEIIQQLNLSSISLDKNEVKTYDEFLCGCIKDSSESPSYEIHKAKIITIQDKKYVEVKNISGTDEYYTVEEFKTNYFDIDDLLKDAIFLGYTLILEVPVQLLYYNPQKGKVIARFPQQDSFVILPEINLNEQAHKDKTTKVYQNKAYLKKEMSKSFDKEYEKKQRRKK